MEYLTAIWQSIILGTVQGLTEFLPVSSSGHLALLHRILGADFGGNTLFFDIMLHVGTLIAVVAVLWRDILELFKKPFKTLLILIVATIPAGVVGLLFNGWIEDVTNGPYGVVILSCCFAVTAVLLLVTEHVAKKRQETQPFGWKHGICMGLVQAVALFPGISRSGSTVAAGVLSGAERKSVAHFSFLMSIPVILGSALVSGIDVVKQPEIVTSIGGSGLVGIAVGVVFAAVSGFFAVKFMLRVIEKANYKWFSLYLALLAVTCLSLYAAGVIV